MTFETTWMKLEGILVSEINQRKKNIILSHLYVESKRQKSNRTKGDHAYKYREQTGGCLRRRMWQRGVCEIGEED